MTELSCHTLPPSDSTEVLINQPGHDAWTFQILDRLTVERIDPERYEIAAEHGRLEDFRVGADGGAYEEYPRFVAFKIMESVAKHLGIYMTTQEASWCWYVLTSNNKTMRDMSQDQLVKFFAERSDFGARMVEAYVRFHYRIRTILEHVSNFNNGLTFQQKMLTCRIAETYMNAVAQKNTMVRASDLDVAMSVARDLFGDVVPKDREAFEIWSQCMSVSDRRRYREHCLKMRHQFNWIERTYEERHEMTINPQPHQPMEIRIREEIQAFKDSDFGMWHKLIGLHQQIVEASRL